MDDVSSSPVTTQPVNPAGSAPVATGTPPPGAVDDPPDPGKLQAEIQRLQEVKEKAEREAAYWRDEKKRARGEYFRDRGDAPRQPAPTPPPAEDLGIGPEPKKEDFDDYEKYLDARVAYATKKTRAEWDRDQERRSRDAAHREKMDRLRSTLEVEGKKKYADFEEVAMDDTVAVTPLMAEILADLESPHDVAYYLGKNRAEAVAIARMTPVQAARALARIEMTIAGGGVPPANPRPPKIPGAPPPITPLGSSHGVDKDLNKMSQREFEEEMEKRTGRRF